MPFFERVFDFLEELKAKEYHTVLVVAHAGVSKAFSAYFEGMGDGGFLNRKFQNCEIIMKGIDYSYYYETGE